MQQRILLSIVVILSLVGLLFFFFESAQIAKKRSNDLLIEFNKINNSLKESEDSLKHDSLRHHNEEIGAFKWDTVKP